MFAKCGTDHRAVKKNWGNDRDYRKALFLANGVPPCIAKLMAHNAQCEMWDPESIGLTETLKYRDELEKKGGSWSRGNFAKVRLLSKANAGKTFFHEQLLKIMVESSEAMESRHVMLTNLIREWAETPEDEDGQSADTALQVCAYPSSPAGEPVRKWFQFHEKEEEPIWKLFGEPPSKMLVAAVANDCVDIGQEPAPWGLVGHFLQCLRGVLGVVVLDWDHLKLSGPDIKLWLDDKPPDYCKGLPQITLHAGDAVWVPPMHFAVLMGFDLWSGVTEVGEGGTEAAVKRQRKTYKKADRTKRNTTMYAIYPCFDEGFAWQKEALQRYKANYAFCPEAWPDHFRHHAQFKHWLEHYAIGTAPSAGAE